jgi:NTP pyrophosphatase (non-canonical NTP hydrolase)
MNGNDWETVGELVAWLDEATPLDRRLEVAMRIGKLSEETGEVHEALTGVLGANPRKGHSHSWDDVENELCDVIITAMVALATISEDPEAKFAERLAKVAARSLGRA